MERIGERQGGSSLKLQCKQAKSITQDEAGTVDSAVGTGLSGIMRLELPLCVHII